MFNSSFLVVKAIASKNNASLTGNSHISKMLCKPTTIGRRQQSRCVHCTRVRRNEYREVQKNEFERQVAPHLPGQPGQPGPNDPPIPVGRNYLVGGLITAFVAGVYSYTMYQMKKQNEMDFLDEIDNEITEK